MPSFSRNEGKVSFEALTPIGVLVATFEQLPVAEAYILDRAAVGVPLSLERVATWTQREIIHLPLSEPTP